MGAANRVCKYAAVDQVKRPTGARWLARRFVMCVVVAVAAGVGALGVFVVQTSTLGHEHVPSVSLVWWETTRPAR